MKKSSLTLLLFSFPLVLFAQKKDQFPIDSITHKVSYSEVIDIDAKKDVLFDRASEWFAFSFKSANDVIQIKDKDAGKIIGSFNVYSSEGGPVGANIILLIKDGKYKYTITDLLFNGNGKFKPWAFEEDPNPYEVGMMKKGIRYIKENSNARVMSLIQSLKLSMQKPTQSEDF